ncbi:hypothetical protein NQ176_g8920 [Zarea fungicola]|uniref:Uncharacterized protein n=1 Tax=Zarea fungicola TaxID=93591 RepID=A0ACC1MQ69_9HYPO|nr:hypothetical protein NQ176_g8920 [Lecanicillium fungicola]
MTNFTDLPKALIRRISGCLRLPGDVNALLRTCHTIRQALGSWPYQVVEEDPKCIGKALECAINYKNIGLFNRVLDLDEKQLRPFFFQPFDLLNRTVMSGQLALLKRPLGQPQAIEALQKLLEECERCISPSLLSTAANCGHADIVDYLLKMPGTDVNLTSGSRGVTALHAAVSGKRNSSNIICMLLKAGADAEKVSLLGKKRPLDEAVASNNVEGVRALLAGGAVADKQIAPDKRYSPFDYLHWKHADAAEITALLLKHGASASGTQDSGVKPLHRAMQAGRDDIVALLLEHQADIFTASDKHGKSGLEYVFQNCNIRTCRLFVEHGAIRRGMRCGRQTIQEVAASSGDTEKLEWALDYQEFHKTLPRNVSNEPSPTQLLRSAGSPRVVELLIRRGADAGDAFYGRPGFIDEVLHSRSRRKYDSERLETLKSLLAHGATSKMTEKQKQDMLTEEMKKSSRDVIIPILIDGKVEVSSVVKTELLFQYVQGDSKLHFTNRTVKQLVHWGADINAVDGNGRTALRLAMIHHHYKSLKLFLDLDADYKVLDNAGNTMLHGIYKPKKNLEVSTVTKLLKLGLDPNAANGAGHTPLDLSLRYANRTFVKTYLEHGTDVHSLRMIGDTDAVMMSTMHLAAVVSYPHGLMMLAELGLDVNGRDDKGRTPLHWAKSKNYEEHVVILTYAGADVDAEDEAGNIAWNVQPGLYPDLEQDFDVPPLV